MLRCSPSLRQCGLEATLTLELTDPTLICLNFHEPPLRLQRSFDGHRLDSTQQLSSDGFVGAPAAEGEAA